MHNFKLLLLLLGCFQLSTTVKAQNMPASKGTTNESGKYTISGYVHEKGSKELLPGVNVYVPAIKSGTVTNAYGFYSITLPKDSVILTFSFVGYTTKVYKLLLDKDIVLNVDIEGAVQLNEVVISAEQQKRVSEETQMSVIEIPIEQIKDIPALLGEKDVLKVIQLMPGVQKGSEGSSGFYVRGGGPDQNLIILDGATVYNAFHLFGFFSLFNGDALKSIELTKGGFPARYGGRLSSVLDMQMKDGSKEKLHGSGGIGIVSSRLTLEGPIKKDTSSFLISARRTYIDALVYPFLSASEKFGYYFYDLNAKLNYMVNQKNKFYLSGYFGKDKFYGRLKDNYSESNIAMKWGNATGTARWNHQFNDKVFSNASFIFCDYTFGIDIIQKDKVNANTLSLAYFSGIRDYSIKYDIDIIPNTNHYIKTGFISTLHRFTPSAVVLKETNTPDVRSVNPLYSSENGVYIEDDIKINSRFKFNVGARLSHFYSLGKNYFNAEPRISARYFISEDFSAKASFATMNQYLHLLSTGGISLPTDLWIPATNRTLPSNSQQVAVGLAKDLPQKNLTLTLEGYYKKTKNVINYKPGASFIEIGDPNDLASRTWEDKITRGRAWSYGAEFLVQRKVGKFTGWIGYTLSWTQMQFDEVNFGKKFYARYDRRHDISVVGIYKFSDHITISATWVYGTGNAITLPVGTYNTPAHKVVLDNGQYYQPITDYGANINAYRMAPYHRGDVAVQFHKQKKRYERTWEVGVYNIYNRKNPFFYYATNVNGANQLMQVSLFPIIPSISWNFKF